MKLTIGFILAIAAFIATLLAVGQKPFAPAFFEYGTYRPYSGVIGEWPAPMLSVGSSRYLLVGSGKHGVSDVVRGLDSKVVTLRGSLIHRGPNQMLELLPGTLKLDATSSEPGRPVSMGMAHFTGEIVDTKCYLGVMNPGEGKVHRQCAARCISGGVPPALAVKDRLILLIGSDDRPIHREVLEFAGETVSVSGELVEAGPITVLRVEPRNFRRE